MAVLLDVLQQLLHDGLEVQRGEVLVRREAREDVWQQVVDGVRTLRCRCPDSEVFKDENKATTNSRGSMFLQILQICNLDIYLVDYFKIVLPCTGNVFHVRKSEGGWRRRSRYTLIW